MYRRHFIVGGLTLLAPRISFAHGPWSLVCCSGQDCDFVDAGFVKEAGDNVHINLPPGRHPMWPADGRGNFMSSIARTALQQPVAAEWGVCISKSGSLLCVYPPLSGV